MGQPVLVRVEGAEFYVQLAEAAGPQPVGLDQVMSFEGVRETVTAVCGELAKAWEVVKPAEASVELALKVVARAGKLTGMLIDGGGEAALKVTLTWKGE